jgi:hypothetical protein
MATIQLNRLRWRDRLSKGAGIGSQLFSGPCARPTTDRSTTYAPHRTLHPMREPCSGRVRRVHRLGDCHRRLRDLPRMPHSRRPAAGRRSAPDRRRRRGDPPRPRSGQRRQPLEPQRQTHLHTPGPSGRRRCGAAAAPRKFQLRDARRRRRHDPDRRSAQGRHRPRDRRRGTRGAGRAEPSARRRHPQRPAGRGWDGRDDTAIKFTLAADDGQPVARIRRSRSPSSSTTASPGQPPVLPADSVTNITLKLLSIMCCSEAPGISQTVAAHDTGAAPEGSPAASGHPLSAAEGGR